MISIITVLYNSEQVWPEFLSSMKETDFGEEIELISHDNTEKNIGLSKAVNLLIPKANGDLILFANPDVRFNDSVRDMISFVRSHPRWGAVPRFSGTSVSRRYTTLTRIAVSTTAFNKYVLERIGFKFIRRDYERSDTPVVEQPGGSFLLMRKLDVLRICLLHPQHQFYDEQFPVFWNDVDMAVRADIFSIRFALISSCEIFHEGAHSHKQVDRDRWMRLFYSSSGMMGFLRKWRMHPNVLKTIVFLDTIFIFASRSYLRILRVEKEKMTGGIKDTSRKGLTKLRCVIQ